MFSGGPDLDPAVYGQDPHPQLGPDVDRVADEYELALLAAATERDLPMLAICRGMQALNVVRGGTLHQHLPDLTELEHRQTPRAVRARAPRDRQRGLAPARPDRPPPARGQQLPSPGRRSPRRRPGDLRARAATGRSRRSPIPPPASASASSGTPSC